MQSFVIESYGKQDHIEHLVQLLISGKVWKLYFRCISNPEMLTLISCIGSYMNGNGDQNASSVIWQQYQYILFCLQKSSVFEQCLETGHLLNKGAPLIRRVYRWLTSIRVAYRYLLHCQWPIYSGVTTPRKKELHGWSVKISHAALKVIPVNWLNYVWQRPSVVYGIVQRRGILESSRRLALPPCCGAVTGVGVPCPPIPIDDSPPPLGSTPQRSGTYSHTPGGPQGC